MIITLELRQQALAKESCDPLWEQAEPCQDDALNLLQRTATNIGVHSFDTGADAKPPKISGFGATTTAPYAHTDVPPTMPPAKDPNSATCVHLTDEEAYFTAPLSIGLPQQRLAGVVDTGSAPLVVADCVLRKKGYLHSEDPCYRSGSVYSMTYKVDPSNPITGVMHYGGGAIRVNMVTDTVEIGGVQAEMDHSLLLITESGLSSLVEGVVGLGLPKVAEDIKPGFLEYSKVQSFSLCFSDVGGGSMVLGHKSSAPKLAQTGKTHWMLNFQGAAVGDEDDSPISLNVCNTTSKLSGSTECSMIPDSGTTHIMLPEDHFTALFAGICDKWDRCARLVTSKTTAKAKSDKATELIEKCDEWWNGKGADEFPDLNIYVAGDDGLQQTLTLSPWSWIIEVPASGTTERTCSPAFTAAEMATEETGTVWVVGMPLFYDYVVNFDTSSEPYSISFSEGTCDGCKASDFLSSDRRKSRSEGQGLRRISKPPRVPSWSFESGKH